MAFGLFFISVGTLLLEVVLTRIFSIYLWNHYAFLVVSLALLGFGASGSFLRFFRPSPKILALFFVLFYYSGFFVYFFITTIPFDPVQISWDHWQFVYLSLFYLIAAIPFFFSGLYLGSCLVLYPMRSGRFYGISLLGSAMGAFFSFLFLYLLPMDEIRLSPYKPFSQALLFPEAKRLASSSTPTGRVDVIQSGAVRFAPGLSLNFFGDLPPQLGLTLDGDRMNALTRFEGDIKTLNFLAYLPSAAPYTLFKKPEVLVMESSGGLNILEALFHEASSVTAMEKNVDMVHLINQKFAAFSGDIYRRPSVEYRPSHHRPFLGWNSKNFDLIVLSLSDNPSATSTGLYGMNENYIFTAESFQEIISHLKPNGLFSLTRYILPPPREQPRILNLALHALGSFKVQDPLSHLAVIESYGTWTLLLKKSPFDENEKNTLKNFSKKMGFEFLGTPDEIRRLIPSHSIFNLEPTSDDRPFFFHFFKLSQLKETYESLGGKWEAFFEGGYLIYFALAQALFWSLVLIFLPVLIRRRVADLAPPGYPESHAGQSLQIYLYFFFIGLAFMFVEMTLLQSVVFLFGDPTYGFIFLLSLLLFFSGLGSLRLKRESESPLLIFLGIVLFIGMILLLRGRWGLSVLMGIPLFYIMGKPFPWMMSRLNPMQVPMAWAVNGVASVLGSILALILAMEWGYSTTLMTAGILYLIAGLLIFRFYLKPDALRLPSSGQISHPSNVSFQNPPSFS